MQKNDAECSLAALQCWHMVCIRTVVIFSLFAGTHTADWLSYCKCPNYLCFIFLISISGPIVFQTRYKAVPVGYISSIGFLGASITLSAGTVCVSRFHLMWRCLVLSIQPGMARHVFAIYLSEGPGSSVPSQPSSLEVSQKEVLLQVALRRASGSSVKNSPVAGLSSLKLGTGFLLENV